MPDVGKAALSFDDAGIALCASSTSECVLWELRVKFSCVLRSVYHSSRVSLIWVRLPRHMPPCLFHIRTGEALYMCNFHLLSLLFLEEHSQDLLPVPSTMNSVLHLRRYFVLGMRT